MSVDAYEKIIKKVFSKFDDIIGVSKECLLDFFVYRYAEKYHIVNTVRKKNKIIIPIWLVDGIYNTPFKYETYEQTLIEYNNKALEVFDIMRKFPGRFFKTTCLSENPKSILMWSHYADQHKGFCIEYDFNKAIGTDFPLKHLLKVTYSDDMIAINLQTLIQGLRKKMDPNYMKDSAISQLSAETCLKAILTKNSAWEYEKEWRIVLDNFSNIKIEKIPYATKIILGINIEEKNKAALLKITKEKNPPIPVYQAYLLPDRYEIGYYPII